MQQLLLSIAFPNFLEAGESAAFLRRFGSVAGRRREQLSGSGSLWKQSCRLIRHPLEKAFKDAQHTVFFIFPQPLPHARSMLATVGGAAERSLVPRGFHVHAGRCASPRLEPG